MVSPASAVGVTSAGVVSLCVGVGSTVVSWSAGVGSVSVVSLCVGVGSCGLVPWCAGVGGVLSLSAGVGSGGLVSLGAGIASGGVVSLDAGIGVVEVVSRGAGFGLSAEVSAPVLVLARWWFLFAGASCLCFASVLGFALSFCAVPDVGRRFLWFGLIASGGAPNGTGDLDESAVSDVRLVLGVFLVVVNTGLLDSPYVRPARLLLCVQRDAFATGVVDEVAVRDTLGCPIAPSVAVYVCLYCSFMHFCICCF